MSSGPFLKRAKGAQGAKIHTFGYRHFGIFAPGAVPRSSALCLFCFVLFCLFVVAKRYQRRDVCKCSFLHATFVFFFLLWWKTRGSPTNNLWIYLKKFCIWIKYVRMPLLCNVRRTVVESLLTTYYDVFPSSFPSTSKCTSNTSSNTSHV